MNRLVDQGAHQLGRHQQPVEDGGWQPGRDVVDEHQHPAGRRADPVGEQPAQAVEVQAGDVRVQPVRGGPRQREVETGEEVVRVEVAERAGPQHLAGEEAGVLLGQCGLAGAGQAAEHDHRP